jgi:hypothetical protein
MHTPILLQAMQDKQAVIHVDLHSEQSYPYFLDTIRRTSIPR